MKNPARNDALLAFATAAALMVSPCFAQSVTPPPRGATPPTTGSTLGSDASSAPRSATDISPASASGGKKSWSELDTNKDGNLSKAEAAADTGMMGVFDKADSNHDGILTPDEYRAYYAKFQSNGTAIK
jgi:hypothetical protein